AASDSASTATISVKGPQAVLNAQGVSYVPAGIDLPYTLNFQNSTDHALGQVRIVTQLDSDVDPRTLRLNDIKLGDITIHIPADKAVFQGDFDFTKNKGFILRVSGGVDAQTHTATWLLQAINPDTGEVLNDPIRGLLIPDEKGGNKTGFVSYTVQGSATAALGAKIDTSARILFDDMPPIDSDKNTLNLDARPPQTSLTVTSLTNNHANEVSYNVKWQAADEASGVKYVTLYVAQDGGDFHIWQKQLPSANGQLVFTGEAGHTYEFLAAATDSAGNREASTIANAVLPDDGGSAINLGSNQTVQTTGEMPAAAHDRTYVSNDIFQAAQGSLNTPGTPGSIVSTQAGDLQHVIAPMTVRAFADGYNGSQGDIGVLAMVQLPDGRILASAGSARNDLFIYSKDGGHNTTPLATFDAPIIDMAVDQLGQLWVMTGNAL
ncbi:MAG: fibronectin type III domain-containing protein, partial [Burkholderiales bacterium]|nr:fibronectin type III domain-containing protein [Burkholderiales bacterium]